jgi:hypothetical protein
MKRLLCTLALLVASHGAAIAQATGQIVNDATGFTIGGGAGSMAEGVQLSVWQHDGSPNQSWSIVPTDDGWFKIVNAGTGLCVDVAGAVSTTGAAIVLSTDDGSASQQWRWLDREGHKILVNRKSREVIRVSGGSTAEGAVLVQWLYVVGAPTQFWHVSP